MDDLISRAVAQIELQLSARRYTVAHEAHGEGRVVWSEDLISVSDAMNVLRKLPSAQLEIIYCKDCRKHNKRIGDYVEKSDGAYDWIWKDQPCPLAEFRGVAQGHEFDYQFCAYGERRTE